jgi:Uma2 family endonuclease
MRIVRARFTRADYALLPEGFPAQLVRGNLVKEPSPTYGHQGLVVLLLQELLVRVPRTRVLPSPVDVPIDEFNVFQPDVAVYAEEPPAEATGTLVPQVVFEILSPSNRVRDRGFKRRRYLEAGVAEVWLVDPAERAIEVCTGAGRATRRGADAARSECLAGFALTADALFGGGPRRGPAAEEVVDWP